MHRLKEMAMKELKEIEESNTLNAHNVSIVKSLTSIIKNIDTINAMEDSKYSNDGSYDGSYAVDRRGRNADGSYRMEGSYRMRNDGGRDQRYSYGYSRELKEDLENLKHKAEGREKEMLTNWIHQLEG